jgi:hypothetical protein
MIKMSLPDCEIVKLERIECDYHYIDWIEKREQVFFKILKRNVELTSNNEESNINQINEMKTVLKYDTIYDK